MRSSNPLPFSWATLLLWESLFSQAEPFSRRGLSSRAALFFCAGFFCAGCHEKSGNWAIYKADALSSSYSELRQINKENVQALKLAWTFNPDDALPGSRFANSECNPIVIDGVMYATSARHRVYAISALTGEKIWSFDPFNGGEGGGVSRGVTYWEDGNDRRILFTGGDLLFALDARTGKPVPGFGKEGKVSMNIGIR